MEIQVNILTCSNPLHEKDDWGCIDCFYDEANKQVMEEVYGEEK